MQGYRILFSAQPKPPGDLRSMGIVKPIAIVKLAESHLFSAPTLPLGSGFPHLAAHPLNRAYTAHSRSLAARPRDHPGVRKPSACASGGTRGHTSHNAQE